MCEKGIPNEGESVESIFDLGNLERMRQDLVRQATQAAEENLAQTAQDNPDAAHPHLFDSLGFSEHEIELMDQLGILGSELVLGRDSAELVFGVDSSNPEQAAELRRRLKRDGEIEEGSWMNLERPGEGEVLQYLLQVAEFPTGLILPFLQNLIAQQDGGLPLSTNQLAAVLNMMGAELQKDLDRLAIPNNPEEAA